MSFLTISETEYRHGEMLKNHLSRSEMAEYELICGQAVGQSEMDPLTSLYGFGLHSIMEHQGDVEKAKKDYLVIDAPSRNSQEYKDALVKLGEDILFLEKDWKRLNIMACNLIKQMPKEMLDIYLHPKAKYELSATFMQFGLKFKCRFDVCIPHAGMAALIDWKTTREPIMFMRDPTKYGYAMQVWVYCLALAYNLLSDSSKAHTLQEPKNFRQIEKLAFEIPFLFGFADKKYLIPGYARATKVIKEIGKMRWERAVSKYQEQMKTKKLTNWTENKIMELKVPYYRLNELKKYKDDQEELGVVVNELS